jgi:site-specific recombinase XerD
MKAELMDITFFKEYLASKGIKESSIYTYQMSLEHFLKTNPDIDEIEDYNRFLIDNTIKKRNYHYYYVLKKYIEWKIEDRKIRDKLLEGLVHPIIKQNIKRERKYLEKDKIYEMINYMQHEKHQILAWIQTETGVRAGDILTLKKGSIVSEVYENEAVVKLKIVGKGDKQIVVTIFNKDLQNVLLNYTNSHIGNDGEYYFLEDNLYHPCETFFMLVRNNYRRYWYDLKQACTSVGMDINDYATHDMRRSFARRIWNRTKDLVVLQKIMNHSDPRTTIRYLNQSGATNIDMYREMQKTNN